jgi:hypothetical protein
LKITAQEERQFYDAAYAAHLQVPDDALLTNRESMIRDLSEPAGAFYERRKLYGAVLQRLLSEPLAASSVLDYGCGLGEWGVLMATEGARVSLLDLRCFADAEFDLVYASAALHHTMKYPNALAELVRVLRPGGKLILAETYGNNRLLNWLRRVRWRLSRQPDDAGEEIILGDRELDVLRLHFRRVEVVPMNLLAMAKRLFRGQFGSPAVRGVMRCLESADAFLSTLVPALQRYCGEALVVAEK